MSDLSAPEVLPIWQHLSQCHWPEWGALLRPLDVAQELDRQAGLAPALLAFGRTLGLSADSLAEIPAAQRAALVVEWSRALSWRLLVPTLGMFVRCGIGLALPAALLPLYLDADHRVVGWSWPDEVPVQDLDGASDVATTTWLLDWLSTTWRPLMDELVTLGQADARVLWQVFAGYWQWWLEHGVLLGAAAQETVVHRRQQLALAVVRERDWPALVAAIHPGARSARNPLYAPWRMITDAAGEAVRQPRLCCHRDRLPGVATCPGCPLANGARLSASNLHKVCS